MALTVLNGPIIDEGESLSAPLDLKGVTAMRITMPTDWTYSAGITFQISTDGEFFNDLFDTEGNEVQVVVTPGAGVMIPYSRFGIGDCFIKFRSGSRSTPVPQPMTRQFAVAVETPASEAP